MIGGPATGGGGSSGGGGTGGPPGSGGAEGPVGPGGPGSLSDVAVAGPGGATTPTVSSNEPMSHAGPHRHCRLVAASHPVDL